MTKPYPMELRERAVHFVLSGESRHAVAARLGLSPSCVIKWMSLYQRTGSVKPGKIGGAQRAGSLSRSKRAAA